MDCSDQIGTRTVFGVFDDLSDPTEPLSTEEIASAVGCTLSVAQARLHSLSSRGQLKSKLIGDTRVWWRPPAVGDLVYPGTGSDETDKLACVPGEHTLIEQVLKASPVSIVVVSPSGKIEFANERAEEMLGLERSEITSRTYRQPEWNIYYDDGTPIPVDEHPITRIFQTGEPVFGFEHWLELPDGTERWLSSNSAPVLSDTGDVEYIITGIEDVSSLKDREDKLTSDETRVIELSSEDLFEPFLAATDGDFQITIDEVITLPDGTALQYLTATGISTKALRDVFVHQFNVLDTRLLRSTEEGCKLEIHVEDATVPLIFDRYDGRVTALVENLDDSGPVLICEVPGNIEPRTIVGEARHIYSDIEVLSHELSYSPRLLYDLVTTVLTDKQFAALQMAYYGGYFDTPRSSTGNELASRLGITRQTYNRHLRKAEHAVFEQLFEASGKGAR